jgi:hypothetical protein
MRHQLSNAIDTPVRDNAPQQRATKTPYKQTRDKRRDTSQSRDKHHATPNVWQ